MHSVKMRPVATHVAWSVCLFVATVSPTKTDERIQQTHRGGAKVRCMGYTLAPLGEYECFLMSFYVIYVIYFEQCVQIITCGTAYTVLVVSYNASVHRVRKK